MIKDIFKKLENTGVKVFSDIQTFKDNYWYTTGSPELDFNLGTFGFPKGIIEISGKSKSGKTTLAMMAIKNFLQKYKNNGGIVLIISSEFRDNTEYASKIGINLDDVLIYQIFFVEEMFMTLKNFFEVVTKHCEEIKQIPKILVVWDSLGASLSKAEIESMDENVDELRKIKEKSSDDTYDITKEIIKKYKNSQMGAFAKNSKMMMKYFLADIFNFKISFIILNHTYQSMNGMNSTVSTGGEWVNYLPTMRLRTKTIKTITIDDIDCGQITNVEVIKNDFGGRKDTEIEILFGYGIILSEHDIEYALEKGILEKVDNSKTKICFMKDKLIFTNTKRGIYTLYKEGNVFLKILTDKIIEARHKDLVNSNFSKEKKEVDFQKELNKLSE